MRLGQQRNALGLRRFRKAEDGASAVEFALILGPLLFVMLGMFEVAMIMFAQSTMEGGLREAARYAMTGQGTEAEREAEILAIIDEHTLGIVDMADAVVTWEEYPSFGNVNDPEPYVDTNTNGQYDLTEPYTDSNGNAQWDTDMGAAGIGSAAEIVQYTVDYDYPLMVFGGLTYLPFVGNISNDGVIHLQSSIVIRNEPWL